MTVINIIGTLAFVVMVTTGFTFYYHFFKNGGFKNFRNWLLVEMNNTEVEKALRQKWNEKVNEQLNMIYDVQVQNTQAMLESTKATNEMVGVAKSYESTVVKLKDDYYQLTNSLNDLNRVVLERMGGLDE